LRSFYGPLYAIVSATKSAFSSFLVSHSPLHLSDSKGVQALRDEIHKDPTGRVAAEYRLWMKEILMPLNRHASELLISNADLFDAPYMPHFFLDLTAHVASSSILLKKWEQGDYSSHFSDVPYPFEIHYYVMMEFTRLKTMQARLLGHSNDGLDEKTKRLLDGELDLGPLDPRKHLKMQEFAATDEHMQKSMRHLHDLNRTDNRIQAFTRAVSQSFSPRSHTPPGTSPTMAHQSSSSTLPRSVSFAADPTITPTPSPSTPKSGNASTAKRKGLLKAPIDPKACKSLSSGNIQITGLESHNKIEQSSLVHSSSENLQETKRSQPQKINNKSHTNSPQKEEGHPLTKDSSKGVLTRGQSPLSPTSPRDSDSEGGEVEDD